MNDQPMTAKPLKEGEKNQPWETRLIAEYVHTQYAPWEKWFNPRLGPIPDNLREEVGDKKASSLYRAYMPYPDAIVATSEALVIIEGKIRASVEAVGQLILYAQLVRETDAFLRFAHLPVRKEIVTPWPNPTLERLLIEPDIKIMIFTPDWVKEYLQHKQHYSTADYRKARDLKKGLGIE
jgi:hypothetical protein